MSLADELLADIEDGDDDAALDDALADGMEVVGSTNTNDASVAIDVNDIDVKMEDPGDGEDQATSVQSVRSIAKLRHGATLLDVMNNIEKYSKSKTRKAMVGAVEQDPEYQLIVMANNLTVEIDNETGVIHKYTRDLYSKRFPELESLVPSAVEYMKTAKALGNNILEQSKRSDLLSVFLPQATVMVVSVTASTTQGQVLTDSELAALLEACEMAIELQDFKAKILAYVESKMSFIAPNMSIIVGASVAAKLMGHAGGLSNLSRMPACNILLLGSQKKTLSGFSSASSQSHQGYIYQCDIVQKIPPDFRTKVARLIANKCTLTARIDSFHQSVDGTYGDHLLIEIEKKIDKLLEPPPVKQVKALPMPIDPPAKKRGGRRYRKMKERLGLTDLRKAANRMTFGHIAEDAYQEDLGLNLGTLGQSSTSRLRAPIADAKTKAKVSKALAQKLHKQNQQYGGNTTVRRQISGTASVAFTPLQGLEIVNPQAAEKSKSDDANKYFSNTSGFRSIKKVV